MADQADGEAKRPRLQLDFDTDGFNRLDELKALSGARTRAEVVRNAVKVYDALLVMTGDGSELRVLLINGDAVREVVPLALLRWPPRKP